MNRYPLCSALLCPCCLVHGSYTLASCHANALGSSFARAIRPLCHACAAMAAALAHTFFCLAESVHPLTSSSEQQSAPMTCRACRLLRQATSGGARKQCRVCCLLASASAAADAQQWSAPWLLDNQQTPSLSELNANSPVYPPAAQCRLRRQSMLGTGQRHKRGEHPHHTMCGSKTASNVNVCDPQTLGHGLNKNMRCQTFLPATLQRVHAYIYDCETLSQVRWLSTWAVRCGFSVCR